MAIVATEACTNLLKHAGGGEVLLSTTGEDDPETQPGTWNSGARQGPGMANLEQCLRDGFSTGGSPGQGLGAIRRLSTSRDFYSDAGRGTAVLARWPVTASNAGHPRHPEAARMGAVNICKPGQDVCGDSWGSSTDDDCMILVADGLGPRPGSQDRFLEAVRMLHQHPELSPAELLERVHLALRSTRGAAVPSRASTGAGTRYLRRQSAISPRKSIRRAATASTWSPVNGTAGHQIHEFANSAIPGPTTAC